MFKSAAFAPLALLPLAMSLLIGCSNANTPAALSNESQQIKTQYNIVNGTNVTAMTEARSSTVLLMNIDIGQNKVIYCTGTLIAKNLVLAAAHCMNKTGITRVGFGLNVPESMGPQSKYPLYRVNEIKPHPAYNFQRHLLSNAPVDLAIFKFDGVIPEGFKVRELPSVDYKVPTSGIIEMIGYGQTSEKVIDPGTLRSTEVAADHIIDTFQVQRTDRDGQVSEIDVTIPGTIVVNQPETGVCSGDSGGPLFVRDAQGQLTYVGVSSRNIDLTQQESIPEDQACHGVSIFVDVRAQLKWITDTAAELNK